jgi:DNA primase
MAKVPKAEIEAIKRGVDLVSLIKSRGVNLKKNGKGWSGQCPFHEDSEPSFSVNVETNLWQCFGCGKGGDAIRFIELIDKVSFREAVKRLSSLTPARSFAPDRQLNRQA